MTEIIAKYPDHATGADLRDLDLSWKKPPYPADCLGQVLDFDGMVKEAGYRLFGKSTRDGSPLDHLNRPEFNSVPTQAEVWELSFAKLQFERYRNGFCLNCATRIKDVDREGVAGKEGHRILRYLLGLFDRTGEPIPPELRQWSEKSRFQEPPPNPQGARQRTWLRNRCIVHTVATLAYLTGNKPTRNLAKQVGLSCCDAVLRAFHNNGTAGLTFGVVVYAWKNTKAYGDSKLGPPTLKRWREQDLEETQALNGQQLDERRERAVRRWRRLPYWREQDWWHGS